ncbi:MAG: ABC transporter ATP-binding protein [Cellulosilyticaceae bacterium]
MKKLYVYMKSFTGVMSLAVLLKLVSTFSDLLVPYLMGIIIDKGIAMQDVSMIMKLCALMLIIAALGFVGTVISHYLSAKGSQGIGEKLRNALYEHIQQLTIYDVERISTASLITRTTNDVEHVQRTILMSARLMVRAPLIMIGGTILSLSLDPYLTGVMFIGMILLLLGSLVVYKFTRPIYRKVQKNLDRMASILRENLSGIRVIKSFDKTRYEVERFDTQSRIVKQFELKAGKINAYMGPSIGLITNLTIIGILYISGMRVNNGQLEIGKIVTILNYINMVLMAMTTIPRMFMMCSRASTSAGRLNEVLDIKETTVYGEEQMPSRSRSVLKFEKISFRYPGTKKYALRHIDFEVGTGQTLGVIGGTGAGKTSLLNLILRLYEPSEGKISFQGKDIKVYDREYLAEKITAAMQQYNIFSMSIKDNIILDMDYDEARLDQSTESAQILDLLENLEEHFEHKVSQNGTNLSGGQKQRISVARTLYRKSDLVILDDVSSALDYKTDLKLRKALRQNYEEQTVILISQRISSVKNADKILVLDKGECVGIGTHEELVSQCEVYQHMCETQENGGGETL